MGIIKKYNDKKWTLQLDALYNSIDLLRVWDQFSVAVQFLL
jgi:hypothetical protein